MNNFRELKVWQRAIDLATEIYSLTKGFPESEKFGLTSQLRRAAISVSSNIAEGSGRQSNPDFKKFLSYALGSLYEIESQIIIAKNLDYASTADIELIMNEVIEIQKMTHGLRSRLS